MKHILNFLKKYLLVCAVIPFVLLWAVPWVKAAVRLREKKETITLAKLNNERKYLKEEKNHQDQDKAKELRGAWPIMTSAGGTAWIFSTKAGLYMSQGDQEPTAVSGGPQMEVRSFAQAASGDWWTASKDGVWRRFNDGRWVQCHTAEAHEITLREGHHPIVTTKHDGVYESHDDGQNWVSVAAAERYRHQK